MRKVFYQKQCRVYLSSITLYLEEHFGELTGNGENIKLDTGAVDRDKVLHNICTILDIHNWVLPDGIPINNDSFAIFFRAQLESMEILFNCFEEL